MTRVALLAGARTLLDLRQGVVGGTVHWKDRDAYARGLFTPVWVTLHRAFSVHPRLVIAGVKVVLDNVGFSAALCPVGVALLADIGYALDAVYPGHHRAGMPVSDIDWKLVAQFVRRRLS